MGRKRRAQQDFKRIRRKVGKVLPKSANATQTAFKTQSIIMPHQSAMADKEEKLLNKSRLSLEDLLGQLRHHGASVRSGALDGLGDYFRRHPSQLHTRLGQTLARCVPCMVDSSGQVRKGCHTLLSFLLAQAPVAMSAFDTLLGAHLCAALSHVHQRIRVDSLQFLSLFLDHATALGLWSLHRQILPSLHNILLERQWHRVDSWTDAESLRGSQMYLCLQRFLQCHPMRSHDKVAARPLNVSGGRLLWACARRAKPTISALVTTLQLHRVLVPPSAPETALASTLNGIATVLCELWVELDKRASKRNVLVQQQQLILDALWATVAVHELEINRSESRIAVFVADFIGSVLASEFPFVGDSHACRACNLSLCQLLLAVDLTYTSDRSVPSAVRASDWSARIVQYLQSELTAAVAVAGKKHTSNSSMLRLSTTLKLVSEAFPRLSLDFQDQLICHITSLFGTCHLLSKGKHAVLQWLADFVKSDTKRGGLWLTHQEVLAWASTLPNVIMSLAMESSSSDMMSTAADVIVTLQQRDAFSQLPHAASSYASAAQDILEGLHTVLSPMHKCTQSGGGRCWQPTEQLPHGVLMRVLNGLELAPFWERSTLLVLARFVRRCHVAAARDGLVQVVRLAVHSVWNRRQLIPATDMCSFLISALLPDQAPRAQCHTRPLSVGGRLGEELLALVTRKMLQLESAALLGASVAHAFSLLKAYIERLRKLNVDDSSWYSTFAGSCYLTRLVGLLARATSASMLPVDHTALDAAVWMLVLVDVRRAQTVPKHSSALLNALAKEQFDLVVRAMRWSSKPALADCTSSEHLLVVHRAIQWQSSCSTSVDQGKSLRCVVQECFEANPELKAALRSLDGGVQSDIRLLCGSAS